MGKRSVSLVAFMAVLAVFGGAYATGENIVASKAYVDTKQDKIPARETKINAEDQSFAPSVVTNGTTDGDVGQMAIITADRMNTESLGWDDYGNGDSLIPTLAAVGNEIERVGRDLIPAENANLIPGQQNVTGMRSVLAPTAAPGIVSQIGLWDADGMDSTAWDLSNTTSNYYDANWTDIDAEPIRQSIPTVGAVEVGLNHLQNQIDDIDVPDISNLQTKIAARATKINAGDNTFAPSVVTNGTTDGNVGQMAILTNARRTADDMWFEEYSNVDSLIPTVGAVVGEIDDQIDYLSSRKQDTIPARATKIFQTDATFAPSVVTNGTTDGNVGQMAILTQARKTADGDFGFPDYYGNDDILIPTVAAVSSEIDGLQEKLIANNATTYPNGSVVTYGATAGNPGQVGIYSGSTPYDATNDSGKIPTMAGVMANVPTDISSNTVNGAPLSNSASYFYGKSTSDATATTKTVSIPSITSLQDGQVIIVTPTVTNTVDSIKLKLNDFPAATIVYAGHAVGYSNSTGQRSIVWSAATPSIFAYEIVDGTGYWRFVGHGKDSNTTYTQMTIATGTAASPSSSGMVVSPATIQGVIQGTKLSDFNSAATATPVTTADTVVGSISKLQAQITDVTADIPTLPTGTSGTVVTYNGVDANNVQQYSENAIASAPVYENGTLTNPNSLATIAAVETKQTKLEANNSTTYPNGSVVTYGATAGNPGQVAIANAPAYNQSTGALTNGTDIASVAAVNTAVNAVKPVCVGWETGHENNDEYCYFWSVPE